MTKGGEIAVMERQGCQYLLKYMSEVRLVKGKF